MDVEPLPVRMHPKTRTAWNRDFRRAAHDYEVSCFDALEQLADVDMGVALRPDFIPIISDAPFVAPHLGSLGYRDAPQFSTFGLRHIDQPVGPGTVRAGQSQPTIRFAWVVILQEENPGRRGLLLRFLA